MDEECRPTALPSAASVTEAVTDRALTTQHVLDQEARAKKIELERAKNPGYGTVLNSGSIWSE